MHSNATRKAAAELARDIRTMDRRGTWTRRQWNAQVRIAIRHFLSDMRRFHAVNSD